MENQLADNKKILKLIYVVSAIIPIVVALLILFPFKMGISSGWISFLPTFHAINNSLTVGLMLGAFYSIKKGDIEMHKSLMMSCLVLGVLFLLSYVIYHSNVESVKFGDTNKDGILSDAEKLTVGTSRIIYLIILFSHILLSIVVVPFVLFAFYYSLTNQIDKHKKIVKFTFPIWLYVSITGVVVYFLIRPYY